jgi:hypothetical protein
MSCDKAHFERYGPFDPSWAIAEEWPLTGAAWRYHRERFLYDRHLTARTSSRRMDLQSFGYLRTFLKWVMVVLFNWARTEPYIGVRHQHADDAGLLLPVPASGTVAPSREVLEGSNRLPGR